ncbi:unnamed protein product [Rotaria sp. Silwood2]|nr:unnamed protein product [Rotaria sp. Silwood2]
MRNIIYNACHFIFFSITWVAFTAGFNSNPSFQITQLYPYEFCWFTHHVIYYFLTTPVCLFLLINIIIFILVAYNILNHVQNATSSDRSYERMKRCVVILLLSCVTQGVGWLLGPFLTFVSEDRANVLGWFFNIFNGLEGLWGIILYIIILSEHTNKQKAAVATEEPRASRESIYHEYETCYEEDNEKEHCSKKEENEVTYQNTENET